MNNTFKFEPETGKLFIHGEIFGPYLIPEK